MNWSYLCTPCAAIAVSVCLGGTSAVPQARSVSFGITPLPVPEGCGSSIPTALNDVGQVVLICQSSGSNQTRSLLWAGGETRWIGEFRSGFVRHEAKSINDSGQVAGSSWAGGFPAAAWSWKDDVFTPLGSLGGANAASFSINESGLQTGWSNVALPQSIFSFYAYVWRSGCMANLGELPEATWSCSSEINDAGQVVGVSILTGSVFPCAFLASAVMGMHPLGTLGGPESYAVDLNDAGQVVGRSTTGRTVDNWWAFHAFLWQAGVMLDLGTLPGEEYSAAVAINTAGDIVGWSQPDFFGSQSRAVLWRGSEVIDLNTTIPPGSAWVLLSTAGINTAGQIIGTGLLNGQSRSFLLTPTP